MFTHNLDPVLMDFGLVSIRWYSLAYVFGIIIGWWYGKKIIVKKFQASEEKSLSSKFDDIITYIIIGIIIGGRLGYVIFYNLDYFIKTPINVLKIWEGGMSFHGALIGVIVSTYFFSRKEKIKAFLLLDVIACVAPIGIFLGRIANFINGELIGKPTNMPWGVIFPTIDMVPRHPSQLYEAFFEGVILFIIINLVMLKKNYKIGMCSYMFLIFYGFLRIISEFFREPDIQVGYLFNQLSMGSILSIMMIIFGFLIFNFIKK